MPDKDDKVPEFSVVKLLSIFRGEWRDIGIIVIYALGVGLCSLVIPISVKSLVNSVAFGTVLQPLVVLTSLVAGVLIFSGILTTLQFIVVEMLQRRLLARISLTLAWTVPHVRQDLFQKSYGSAYLLRFMEAFNLQKIAALLALDGLAVLLQTSIGLLLLAFYHPFFLGFSFVLLLLLLFIVLVLGRGGIASSIEESDAKYEVATWMQDLTSCPIVFKSGEGVQLALDRANELVNTYLDRRSDHFRVLMRQHLATVALQVIASSALLGLGGLLVINGQLTLGQLVAAELVIATVLSSVTKFSKHLEKLYDMAAAVVKLDSLVSLPREDLDGAHLEAEILAGEDTTKRSPAHLALKKVQIAHKNRIILDDVTFELKPGEKVVILGDNGSGKSALANIIYRLSNPEKGRVEIDGLQIQDMNPIDLRGQISLARDVEIFNGTLEQNLRVGRKSISQTEIRWALDTVGLSERVYSLPLGLRTIMRGTREPFSKGEAYLLMVARAILAKPRLLIVDGAIDRIDDRLLPKVIGSLTAPGTPWTLIVMTHERDIGSFFDRALVIRDSRLESFTTSITGSSL